VQAALSRATALQRGPRVYLRRPTVADQGDFLAAVDRSRALHGARVRPPRSAAEYARYLRRRGHGDELHLVCRRGDDALVGVFNLSEIVRGPLHSANLGYYAFAPLAGQGYMSDGLALVLRQAFARYKLHRLEVSVQPDNRASLALVRAAGFRREGYSPRYLKLAGRWRDHVRLALLAEEWRGRRVR
jgi:[ribosomal protein S5]-alanine N-acetyltransferase